MRKMIGTSVLGLGMAAAPLVGISAETVRPTAESTKPSKEQRIAFLKKEISSCKLALANVEGNIAGARKNGRAPHDGDVANLRILTNRIEHATIEIDWQEGRLTKESAEVKVKTAEEAVKKAEDAKSDEKVIAPLKAALETAKKELAAVTALEAKGEF